MDRENILRKLHNEIDNNRAIIGTAAGIGLAAKCQAIAGSDFIVIDNAARFRMAGHGSIGGTLAFSISTENLFKQIREIVPVVGDTPAFAGVTANDPYYSYREVIEEICKFGISGVCNSPSAGFWDDFNSSNFSKLGIGYECEIEMISYAHQKNLFTVANCYKPEQARQMTLAGADIIVANIGLTAGGFSGVHTTYDMDKTIEIIQNIADTVHTVDKDRIVLCHGGLINSPSTLKTVLGKVKGVVGLMSGSATDRIPMELAITETAKLFKYNRLKSI